MQPFCLKTPTQTKLKPPALFVRLLAVANVERERERGENKKTVHLFLCAVHLSDDKEFFER